MKRIYFHPRLSKIIYTYEENGVYTVKIENVSIAFYSEKGNARTKPEIMEFTVTSPFEITFLIQGDVVKSVSRKIKELVSDSIIIAVEAN